MAALFNVILKYNLFSELITNHQLTVINDVKYLFIL